MPDLCHLRHNGNQTMTETIHYLSVTEVARIVGVAKANISAYRMPPPDAWIGKTRGWLPATIDAWMAGRPGSGRWVSNPTAAP